MVTNSSSVSSDEKYASMARRCEGIAWRSGRDPDE